MTETHTTEIQGSNDDGFAAACICGWTAAQTYSRDVIVDATRTHTDPGFIAQTDGFGEDEDSYLAEIDPDGEIAQERA